MHRERRETEPAEVTRTVFLLLLLCFTASVRADSAATRVEGDYLVYGFALASAEVIPELKLHYRTLGAPTHDETGLITNAVLFLRGARQGGEEFFSEEFTDALFGPRRPLDASQYFLIFPDRVEKAGMPGGPRNADFLHYTAVDLVRMQYRLVLEHLGINHLRMIVGNTTGGGQAWLWASTHPYFVDALVVIDCLASQPEGIAQAAAAKRKNDADGGSYQAQAIDGEQVAADLGSVRAKTVAILDEDALTPERLAILKKEIALVRNARYLIVRNDHAGVSAGAISMVQKWKVILPELLEVSESQ
jgi:homoserine acetyltransferase